MLKFYVCHLVIHLCIYFQDNKQTAGFSNRVIRLLSILNIDSTRQSNTDDYLRMKTNMKIKKKLFEVIQCWSWRIIVYRYFHAMSKSSN